MECIVGFTTAGAMIGAIAGGPINNALGRKPSTMIASVVFTVGALLTGLANSFGLLLFGRIVV